MSLYRLYEKLASKSFQSERLSVHCPPAVPITPLSKYLSPSSLDTVMLQRFSVDLEAILQVDLQGPEINLARFRPGIFSVDP